jgi:hypothetical protein
MIGQRAQLSIVAGVVILLATGARAGAAQSDSTGAALVGTWVTTVAADDFAETVPPAVRALLTGLWELDVRATGRYTAFQHGKAVVEGRWTATDRQVRLTDDVGALACLDPGQETAVYAWGVEDDRLALRVIDDPCAGRALLLTLRSLFRRP